MGYACPVCGDPQADGSHLANHLAFTAMVRGGDHEEWLDEHAPDWESMGEDDLAGVVVEAAETAEYPQVFEDTTDQYDRGNTHLGASDGQTGVPDQVVSDLESGSTDADVGEIVEEARAMTREKRGDEPDNSTGDDETTPDESGSETK